MAAQRKALFHGRQDLADAEHTDHRDEEVDAAQQIRRAMLGRLGFKRHPSCS
jgi:hypothetical protein